MNIQNRLLMASLFLSSGILFASDSGSCSGSQAGNEGFVKLPARRVKFLLPDGHSDKPKNADSSYVDWRKETQAAMNRCFKPLKNDEERYPQDRRSYFETVWEAAQKAVKPEKQGRVFPITIFTGLSAVLIGKVIGVNLLARMSLIPNPDKDCFGDVSREGSSPIDVKDVVVPNAFTDMMAGWGNSSKKRASRRPRAASGASGVPFADLAVPKKMAIEDVNLHKKDGPK